MMQAKDKRKKEEGKKEESGKKWRRNKSLNGLGELYRGGGGSSHDP